MPGAANPANIAAILKLCLSIPFEASVIQPDFRKFAVRMAFYLVVGNLLLLLPWVRESFVEPWTEANVLGAVRLSRVIGEDFPAAGTLVLAGPRNLDVKPGCNGVHALVLCLSAVLAYPASGMRRVAGVVLGIVLIFGINLLRLVNLFLVARYIPDQLELFHVFLWQTLMGIVAFGVFLLWGRYLADSPGPPAAPIPD